MKSKLLKGLLSFFLVLGIFIPFSEVKAEAAAKKGEVDIKSGVLNMRSGPGTKYKIVETLKDNTIVSVYSSKNGWIQIKYKNKNGYVSDDYLKIYSSMSVSNARKLVQEADKTQRITWEKNYTKVQINSIMASKFKKSYIDKYIKQQFRKAGKNKNGTQLYHIMETEIWGLALYPIDWDLKYEPKKPVISSYKKNGQEYLLVSQYHLNEMDGNKTTTIYFQKDGSKWKVYDHRVKYE
ncbi:SH3 domain-containing protein [Niallia nealsonii]|uniref:SH3b domain-containing protein n=1 Tax=Niallia nealsonii TaxID=115979 RepID=A0A2N0Z424_9BACI|nr:SH3 domain-containing protein [Niallia nealsonii]PKG24244.1 hypothetical protein CWS01_07585 [Niallia nealsonii]